MIYEIGLVKAFFSTNANALLLIKCPFVLMQTAPSKYTAPARTDKEGVLLATMSEDDAQCAHALIQNNVLLRGSNPCLIFMRTARRRI